MPLTVVLKKKQTSTNNVYCLHIYSLPDPSPVACIPSGLIGKFLKEYS